MAPAPPPQKTGRPLLILVSPMFEATRGYMVEAVARDHRLWLFSEAEPTWETPYIDGYTRVDTLDADAMVQAAREVPADGILCWDETRILPSALVAAALGLPGLPPAAVRTCRDKHATREAVAAAGGPQAASRAVSDLPQALEAADAIGYPVVVKPRALVGSNGTTLVASPEELAAVLPRVRETTMVEVRDRFSRPVLIEEYLDGPEISVDALCRRGEVQPLFVARKELAYPPAFEEVGHLVDAADPLLKDPALHRALATVHEAVGLEDAWTHTEWRLTRRGPKLVEINARSGGDLIPYLGRLAVGVDAGLVAADLALGREPRLELGRSQVAAIRFLYPPQDTFVERVEIDRGKLPEQVRLAEGLASPGQELRLPPHAHVTGRYAMLVVTADTVDACRSALTEAAGCVRLISAAKTRT